MKPLKKIVILTAIVVSLPVLAAGTDNAQEAKPIEEQLADARQQNEYLKTTLIVLTAAYVFVYIMGRRRLMRKIWARNRELKVALDKAEESDRMKSAFIRNMSHEIRTPLNAINGFSQLLCMADGDLTQKEREDMVGRITKSVDTITGIVAEVLDMSEGESSQQREPVAVNGLCLRLVEELKSRNDKGVFLMFESDLDERFTIYSSEKNVERILRRLLDNALKFTEQGTITVNCAKHSGQVAISISDTGIGIPPEHQEQVFENFVKLDEYAEGIGLGLPLSRRLARMLGGDVVLDTSYTAGSRFVVTLPVRN